MCSCIIRFNQNLGFCIIGFQKKKKKFKVIIFLFFFFKKIMLTWKFLKLSKEVRGFDFIYILVANPYDTRESY